MRILLINPVIRKDEKPKYFPLGLGMIHAVLAAGGHELKILDFNALRLGPEEMEARIRSENFDAVGLTGLITEYNQVKMLTQMIRRHRTDAPIVLGGGLASSATDAVLLHTGINVTVLGEGERTAAALFAALEKGESYRELPGIAYLDAGRVVKTDPAEPIADLDGLPFAERTAFPAEIYLEGMRGCWMFTERLRAISVVTSRGCPYACQYCDKAIWGRRFRQRSAANVVDEVLDLKKRFNMDAVVFADDTFVLRRKFVEDFCNEMIRRAPTIRWFANGRVGLLDPDLLALMKKAGCATLGFGIESGSQKILDELRKGVKVEDMIQTLQWVKEAGIRPLGYMVVGSFSEMPMTVAESIALLHLVKVKSGVNFLTPFPGTPLYEQARQRGLVGDDILPMLESWDTWQDHLMVNMTKMSDEELSRVRKELEKVAYSY